MMNELKTKITELINNSCDIEMLELVYRFCKKLIGR